MIRVIIANEPQSFDRTVRQPGLVAIAELVGETSTHVRKGPKRKAIAATREDISGKAFPPFWRKALPDMLTSYKRLCAYLGLYIEHGTGNSSIDHMVPKSRAWDRVYEWSNYRLACGLMNSRKSSMESILDPCEIEEGWFAIEFVAYQVKPADHLPATIAQQVWNTITQLALNDEECCKARGAYIEGYLDVGIPLSHVEERSPFIARELRRQGHLRPPDA